MSGDLRRAEPAIAEHTDKCEDCGFLHRLHCHHVNPVLSEGCDGVPDT
nr:MAG TPA: IcmS, IcmW, IcmO (DotL) IV secretion system, Coupling.8A [Caudoviricetes sp.]